MIVALSVALLLMWLVVGINIQIEQEWMFDNIRFHKKIVKCFYTGGPLLFILVILFFLLAIVLGVIICPIQLLYEHTIKILYGKLEKWYYNEL